MTERMRHELRPQCRASDAYNKEVGEGTASPVKPSAVNVRREAVNIPNGRLDFAPDLSVRCQSGIAEPIMADHTAFIGVRQSAFFQSVHFGKGFVELGLEASQVAVIKTHPADIQGESERRTREEIFAKTVPSASLLVHNVGRI